MVGKKPDPKSDDPNYNQSQSQFFRGRNGSPGNASFTLSPAPLSTLELANVGATLISGGVWCPPNPIQSVTDRDGHPVSVPQQACEQVVTPGLAHTLAAGLSQDSISGTSAVAATASKNSTMSGVRVRSLGAMIITAAAPKISTVRYCRRKSDIDQRIVKAFT